MAVHPSFEHVLKVAIILGRALCIQMEVEGTHTGAGTMSPHEPGLEKLRALERVLDTFCWAASAAPTGGSSVSSVMQLWLKVLTRCTKMIMLHPPAPTPLRLCHCASADAESHSLSSSTLAEPECVEAAMSAATAIAQALDKTVQGLHNPFLLPMACSAVRGLAQVQPHLAPSQRARTLALVNDILHVVEHVAVKYPGAAARAREAIEKRVDEFTHGPRPWVPSGLVGMDR
jgi:hypothetical protein